MFNFNGELKFILRAFFYNHLNDGKSFCVYFLRFNLQILLFLPFTALKIKTTTTYGLLKPLLTKISYSSK